MRNRRTSVPWLPIRVASDPANLVVTQVIHTGGDPSGIAVGNGRVWVTVS